MNERLYPLRFVPIFQDYLWGGTRLREQLHKEVGVGCWAESWEIVDHPRAQSIVADGWLQGMKLSEVLSTWGPQLVGAATWKRICSSSMPPPLRGRFPLLFKILDAARDLSIQVHPDDVQAARLDPPDLGKTEAWVVLDAQAGARIFAGTRPGVTREEFQRAISAGTTAELMHSFEPQIGDCIYIPAGTLHAIGGGLLIAEIQQASDTTYRVFDWNRTDEHGRSRPLHIEEALGVADFSSGPIAPQTPVMLAASRVEQCAVSPYFRLRRWRPTEPLQRASAPYFRLLFVSQGSLALRHETESINLRRGDTVLLPAAMAAVTIRPSAACEFLEYLPGTLDLSEEPPIL